LASRLDSGSDRNDNTPPEDALAVLTAQRLLKRDRYENRPHHFSAFKRRQLENGQIDDGSSGCSAVGRFNRR
jgi:hypothetical protein